jgi:Amt family ammonium transporter
LVSGAVLLFALTLTGPVLAAPPSQTSSDPTDWTVLALGITYLLPIGLILLSMAAFPEEGAISATTGALVVWGLAVLAYFAVGFAFQFGGIAVFHDDPDLAGLYWEYSMLDTTWGTGWGMIGLKGFLLLDAAATAGALTLFLSQLPFLGMATLLVYFALQGRTQPWVILLASLLLGSLIYPIIGNWVWAAGWLANLGINLGFGHGLVDAGGSGQAILVGASAALAALLVFRKRPAKSPNAADETPDVDEGTDAATGPHDGAAPPDEPEIVSMPPVQLPLLSSLGATLMLIGWIGTVFMTHLPTAVDVLPEATAVNLVLSGLGATLTAGLYSWFTTSKLNPLMGARGMAAGLVVVAAAAPLVPAWSALAAGLVIGLLLPLLIYLFDRVIRLDDTATAVAALGIPAILGLLLAGVVADGRYGVGWNRVGEESYLGVAGQGVSGLLVAPGFTPDWPGQIYAQLVGIAAIFAWSFVLSWLLLRILAGLIHAWERTGWETGPPPKPVNAEDEVSLMRDEHLGSAADDVPEPIDAGETREPDTNQSANAPQP